MVSSIISIHSLSIHTCHIVCIFLPFLQASKCIWLKEVRALPVIRFERVERLTEGVNKDQLFNNNSKCVLLSACILGCKSTESACSHVINENANMMFISHNVHHVHYLILPISCFSIPLSRQVEEDWVSWLFPDKWTFFQPAAAL